MFDLREQGNTPLFPDRFEGKLAELWTGLKGLVLNVLLPLLQSKLLFMSSTLTSAQGTMQWLIYSFVHRAESPCLGIELLKSTWS